MTWDRIEGFFNFASLYAEIAMKLPRGAVCVEVGSWHGRSACFLGAMLRVHNPTARLYCVDHGLGSPELQPCEPNGPILVANVRACGLADIVEVILEKSTEAAGRFADGSLDFCFIDADHAYSSVLGDLRAWAPKLKPGGLLAGHDYSIEWPGVVRAVEEFFGQKPYRYPDAESVWLDPTRRTG
jgi:predicted O-methyltransferase YrrM